MWRPSLSRLLPVPCRPSRDFTSWPGDERRAFPRWPVEACQAEARLAWEDGRPPYKGTGARVIDISMGGARILTGSPWLGIVTVRVRLDAMPFEWVRARVRAVRSAPGGARLWCLHLAFSEPCPVGVLEEAISRDLLPPTPRGSWSCDDPGWSEPPWFERG